MSPIARIQLAFALALKETVRVGVIVGWWSSGGSVVVALEGWCGDDHCLTLARTHYPS